MLFRSYSVVRLDDGSYEAVVELIRVTDGAIIGRASALCGMDETWGTRQEFARRSMAITRATGKAYRLGFSWIMTLTGYEATPAEEMTEVVEAEYHEQSPMTGEQARQVKSPRGTFLGELTPDKWQILANGGKGVTPLQKQAAITLLTEYAERHQPEAEVVDIAAEEAAAGIDPRTHQPLGDK